MLRSLRIINFSVFEDVLIEFSKGLNIITGETGAGKSVLIDSIKMALGERFSKEKQRKPDEKTYIEAVFEEVNVPDEIVERYNVEDILVIRREIDSNGKNKIFVNGYAITLNELKIISQYLVDIHGQHDHQLLLNPENHKNYIDKFVDKSILQKFNDCYERYQNLKSKLRQLIENRSEIEFKRELLQSQLNEIEELQIDLDNDSKLEDRIKFLSNIEKIKNAINNSLQLLSYSEINIEGLLNEVLSNLSSIKDSGESIFNAYTRAEEISYLLNDLVSQLESVFDFENYDPEELNNLIDRKIAIDKLCKKYGPTLEDVLQYKENIVSELDLLSVDDNTIDKLNNDLNNLLEELKLLDNELYLNRLNVFKKLKKDVESILKELELKDAELFLNFQNYNEITKYGSKIPEFLLTTNKGFEPAPLHKIASGGELSRIMLALKSIFSEYDSINTLIFDEVDTGISGKTAKKVGEKLKRLSQKKQLIVITHLPVVAAFGDTHFHIEKTSKGDKTEAIIRQLDDNEKKEILATMIAGRVTEHSLKQALELLAENG
ncbi:DNA repair protein RecN [Deferribacter thermophilus]|uniref:DNA repair protein RecN n=1 Tax=Deferribacter thermophilus TaxID=53573 RepID=UPI003C18FD87